MRHDRRTPSDNRAGEAPPAGIRRGPPGAHEGGNPKVDVPNPESAPDGRVNKDRGRVLRKNAPQAPGQSATRKR